MERASQMQSNRWLKSFKNRIPWYWYIRPIRHQNLIAPQVHKTNLPYVLESIDSENRESGNTI